MVPGEGKHERQPSFQPVTLNRDTISGRLKTSSLSAGNLPN